MSQELTKKQIAEIKSLYTRHGRKKSPFCVVEGVRACEEIFTRVPELVEYVVISDDYHGKTPVPTNLICYSIKKSLFETIGNC